MGSLAPCFTERESAVSQTLGILHYPHVLVFQILRFEHGQFAPAALGKIYHEFLCIERNLKHPIAHIARYRHSGIQFASLQRLYHEVNFHFLYRQFHCGIHLPIVSDELRQYVWRYRGTYRQSEPTAYLSLVFRNYLADALNLHQRILCLTDYLFAGGGRRHRSVGAVKDSDVEFFFQFLQHGAERWLRYITRVSRFRKIAEAVDGDYVSELL